MWELDHNESWALKNWCFWTVVLEKTVESLLDSKEVKPFNPKANQLWISIGRTDAEAEAPISWSPDVNSQLIGKDPEARKDWGQKEKRASEEMGGWHHWCNGHELGETLGDGDGQGGLVCCSSCGHKESDMTGWLNSNNNKPYLNYNNYNYLEPYEDRIVLTRIPVTYPNYFKELLQ